jgi:hypothetical protein
VCYHREFACCLYRADLKGYYSHIVTFYNGVIVSKLHIMEGKWISKHSYLLLLNSHCYVGLAYPAAAVSLTHIISATYKTSD